MKKKMRKAVALLVCLIMIFSILESRERIKADDLRHEYVKNAECSISITSGTATVLSTVKGKTGTTAINITVYVDSYYNGEWNYYMSWTHSGVDQNNNDSIPVIVGIYRVRMHVTATSGGNTESFDVNGNTAIYLGL